MAFFGFLSLANLSAGLLLFSVCAAQTHVYDFCIGEKYTANSLFQANLKLLLSSISNNTAPGNIRFNNVTEGRNSDTAYGLFQCRGDYSLDDCKRFAVIATNEITDRCPFNKEAIIYYNEFLLRYSDKSFFSTLQSTASVPLCNSAHVSINPNLFSVKRDELMQRLIIEAASDSTNMFAAGDDSVTSSQKIYGLVQCTQDLSTSNCGLCLRKVVFELGGNCNGNTAGAFFMPSCNAMFNDSKFFLSKPITGSPDPAAPPGLENKATRKLVLILIPVLITVLLLSIIITVFFCRSRRKKGSLMVKGDDVDALNSVQSLQLDFAVVRAATGNFSDAKKLGEGGFGAVYQGKLADGREIAVKRLSKNSVQGVVEFKNEVVLLSELEHRNLVRLLGFSLEGDEKLLIYEFVPNASLDHYIFGSLRNPFILAMLDPLRVACLDWEKRYKIIQGIARGLMYLHEDSPNMIIHRDLKTGNILLDENMRPKIADFGMAKLFVVDQSRGCTKRVVGTFGYMAPEYAANGHFSVKSDVFSFGVIVLEIISGRKNNRYYESQGDEYLLSKAWKHQLEGTTLELLEPALGESYSPAEVIRCVHIGLLCVQEDPVKRPTMASVVLMLNRSSGTLPLPSAPAFFVNSATKHDTVSEELETNKTTSSQSTLQDDSISGSTTRHSINEVSITELYPR